MFEADRFSAPLLRGILKLYPRECVFKDSFKREKERKAEKKKKGKMVSVRNFRFFSLSTDDCLYFLLCFLFFSLLVLFPSYCKCSAYNGSVLNGPGSWLSYAPAAGGVWQSPDFVKVIKISFTQTLTALR